MGLRMLTAALGSALLTAGLAAAPVSAGDPGESQPSWVMPDVEGKTLQQAAAAVRGLTGNPDLEFHISNYGWKQEQLVWSMWEICWQAPQSGQEFTENSWIGFGVARPHGGC